MRVKRCEIVVCNGEKHNCEVWAEQTWHDGICLAGGRTEREALANASRRLRAMDTEIRKRIRKESKR